MIKRSVCIILLAVILLGAIPFFGGCSKKDDGKITVICTVFPIYDWVRNIVGDSETVEVKLLVSNGADLHSYQPTTDDIIAIREAEAIVRVGGQSDAFLNDILPQCDDIKDIKLMSVSGVTVRESLKESHIHTEGDGHSHAADEHIWLSVKNAKAAVSAICESLCALDEANADKYRANAAAYAERLTALDVNFSSAMATAEKKKIVFADRFPFIYVTEEYGIEHAAAFEGCTTESDASFETVIRLASKLDEWGLEYIAVTESSDKELAGAVINASSAKNARILVFDSMQSVTSADISAGKSYIGIMESNLQTLRIAVGAQGE